MIATSSSLKGSRVVHGLGKATGHRLALAAVLVSGLVSGLLAGVGSAQIVKAPRYQGERVEAPQPQLNLPPLPKALTPNGTVVEEVVVRVNDQIISRSDVERAEQQLQQDAAQANMPPGELALRQRDMLRDQIDQQLLLSRAKELGLNADAEVIRRLDDIRKQNKMASLDDLDKAARAQGVSFEDFKAQIRNQILTQQVVRDEVGRNLKLNPEQEQKYYQEHAKDFEQPEQIRLSEILVPLADNATHDQVAAAEAKANDIKTKVMQQGDFADLAKKYSGGPSAGQGGELGLFKRGSLAKVLEDQTFDLKPGESTQPIRTRQGYVILKVTEHLAAGVAPLKDVEPQIQEAIYMQAMQPALRAYLTKLREQAYIDLEPGFTDSGASSNETKPVFTAYAPPPVKKKKPKDKARFDRGGRYSTVAATRTKVPVVASPDTTGTRTLTGQDAATTPAGVAVDPATGLAVLAPTKAAPAKSASKGKAPKIHREKVRFGQAPRNALAPGEDDTVATTDGGASTPDAQSLPKPVESADLADNPLAPPAPEQKKTRFAAREKQVQERKQQTLSAKEYEKKLATPAPAGTDEVASRQEQSGPLGLNGDTAKKPKKPKRTKGDKKERLQGKAPAAPAAPMVPDPTANPNLAPTDSNPVSTPPSSAQPANSSVPRSVPNVPDTTLPPVTTPVPGSPQQGTPVPGTIPPSL